jgi:hypothetical protein
VNVYSSSVHFTFIVYSDVLHGIAWFSVLGDAIFLTVRLGGYVGLAIILTGVVPFSVHYPLSPGTYMDSKIL